MPVLPQLTIRLTPGEYLAAYQGVYSATTTYQPQQIVELASYYYIALQPTVGHAPANGLSDAYWQNIGTDSGAAAGPEGPAGPEGTVKVSIPGNAAAAVAGKEYEPSATVTATVYLTVVLKAEKVAFEILVEGKPVYKLPAETVAAGNVNQTFMFRVKAKGKWELKFTEGAITSASAVVQEG